MDTTHLWDKLPLPEEKLPIFKKDIAEGKVPELPFNIIGQGKLKKIIETKIAQIDSNRMITNLIIAQYGNGKTNLLKYLELFFSTYRDRGVSVQYSRADVERTDLVLFLLKIVQDKYLKDLMKIVKDLRNNQIDVSSFVNNFQGNFREIKEYTEKLFEAVNSDEDITEILYLGTGRLSTKRYFEKRGIEQLRDFNRREVLVLFLNLLSYDEKYIIFAIDEIEKISEKSKIRFSHFLTSYRELIDLFNQIKGHYLIVCLTYGVGSSDISTYNEALYTRIKNDIIDIEALTDYKEIDDLIIYLNELFETDKNVQDIHTVLLKKDTPNNRVKIQEISKLLYSNDVKESLELMIKKVNLKELFLEIGEKLENDEAFKNIHRKFFDPLEYYIDSLGLNSNGLNKQDRTFIDFDSKKVHYFIFNTYLEDFENEKIKISKLIYDNPDCTITVYSPIKLELTQGKLKLDNGEKVEIIDIDPKELFILLVMYKGNYDLQPILGEIISNYTSQKL